MSATSPTAFFCGGYATKLTHHACFMGRPIAVLPVACHPCAPCHMMSASGYSEAGIQIKDTSERTRVGSIARPATPRLILRFGFFENPQWRGIRGDVIEARAKCRFGLAGFTGHPNCPRRCRCHCHCWRNSGDFHSSTWNSFVRVPHLWVQDKYGTGQ